MKTHMFEINIEIQAGIARRQYLKKELLLVLKNTNVICILYSLQLDNNKNKILRY